MLKLCTRCEIKQECHCFANDKYRSDGLKSWCRSCVKEVDHIRHLKRMEDGYYKNREARGILWKQTHSEEIKVWCKSYMKTYRLTYKRPEFSKISSRAYSKKYKEEHPEQTRANRNRWFSDNYKNNSEFRFMKLVRNRIRKVYVNKDFSDTKIQKDLGYSSKELFNHLSQYVNKPCYLCNSYILQLEDKNTNIEHIIPLGLANTREQIIELNQLSNLCLVCAFCNSQKRNRDCILIKVKKEQQALDKFDWVI